MIRSSVRLFLVLSAVMALAAFSSCRQNRAPSVPTVPTGYECGYKDMTYTFKTTAVDPDGDSVAVRFDWGDSTVSNWEGWFASGDSAALAHVWSDTGTFEVRASAQDLTQHTSGLSGGLTVRVGLRWPPNVPAVPTGPGVGGKDSSYAFTTAASHPGSITVAIRFAWGDGDTSDWSSFVAPGESVAISHAWAVPDTYAVTAQAKDTGYAVSFWSLQHNIIVRPLDTLCKWRLQLATGVDMELKSSPAIAPDGTIYVGSPDSSLYAINPDGTLKWRYLTGGNVQASPSIAADGTVYFGSDDQYLYAINPDGTRKWTYEEPWRVATCPAIAVDGTIYLATDACIHAVSAGGGDVWRFWEPDLRFSASAVAANGVIYGVTRAGVIDAVWPEGTGYWGQSSWWGVNPTDPAIAGDGTIYFGSEGSFGVDFNALRPNGTFKWHYVAGREVRSSPVVATDGTVYFGSTDNGLYALNADGTLKWRYETGADVDAGPAIAADGTVYVGSDDNCLYAVNADGTLKWRYETGGQVEASTTIGADGTVYFTSNDGYLYALRGTSPLADAPWPKSHHDLRNTGRAGGEGLWSRIDTVGDPILAPDRSAFTVHVVNAGNGEFLFRSLEFIAGPDSAYMRNFLVNGANGFGYPTPDSQSGTGPGDTMRFLPHVIQPNRSSQCELQFLDFHVDSPGVDTTTNVVGKEFRFRFPDGSEIGVQPH